RSHTKARLLSSATGRAAGRFIIRKFFWLKGRAASLGIRKRAQRAIVGARAVQRLVNLAPPKTAGPVSSRARGGGRQIPPARRAAFAALRLGLRAKLAKRAAAVQRGHLTRGRRERSRSKSPLRWLAALVFASGGAKHRREHA